MRSWRDHLIIRWISSETGATQAPSAATEAGCTGRNLHVGRGGRLAAAQHGLRTLRAATSRENTASQKVLAKGGVVPAGPADPAHLGGKQGTWYQRDLTAGDTPQQRAAARDQDGT